MSADRGPRTCRLGHRAGTPRSTPSTRSSKRPTLACCCTATRPRRPGRRCSNAMRLRTSVTWVNPWGAVWVRLEMADAHLLLGDPEAARILLQEAEGVLYDDRNSATSAPRVDVLRQTLSGGRPICTEPHCRPLSSVCCRTCRRISRSRRSANGCTSRETRSAPRPTPSTGSWRCPAGVKRSTGPASWACWRRACSADNRHSPVDPRRSSDHPACMTAVPLGGFRMASSTSSPDEGARHGNGHVHGVCRGVLERRRCRGRLRRGPRPPHQGGSARRI